MSERETMFSCPNCGDPCATTVERNLDIHSGATYRCAQCGQRVVFEAMTTSGYVEYANLAAQLAALEAERDRLREAAQSLRDELNEKGIAWLETIPVTCGYCGTLHAGLDGPCDCGGCGHCIAIRLTKEADAALGAVLNKET
jgi:transcription elongation factor Elf1